MLLIVGWIGGENIQVFNRIIEVLVLQMTEQPDSKSEPVSFLQSQQDSTGTCLFTSNKAKEVYQLAAASTPMLPDFIRALFAAFSLKPISISVFRFSSSTASTWIVRVALISVP